MRIGGATSQLDLSSLTPLSIAGCGRLQLGVPHWATSVYYCKYLIIDPTFFGSRFSTGRLMAIEDFTFYFTGRTKLKKRPQKERTIMKYLPGLSHDTKLPSRALETESEGASQRSS